MWKEYDFLFTLIYRLQLYLFSSPPNWEGIEIPHVVLALLSMNVLHGMNEMRNLM